MKKLCILLSAAMPLSTIGRWLPGFPERHQATPLLPCSVVLSFRKLPLMALLGYRLRTSRQLSHCCRNRWRQSCSLAPAAWQGEGSSKRCSARASSQSSLPRPEVSVTPIGGMLPPDPGLMDARTQHGAKTYLF